MTRDVELNIGWEPLVRVRGPEDDTGIGDVNLGVRYRFVEGFEGGEGLRQIAGRLDFGALLLASFELPHEFELEVNLGGAAVGEIRPNGYLAQAIATASLSRDLAPSLLGFLELLFNKTWAPVGWPDLRKVIPVPRVGRRLETLSTD